MPEQLVLKEWGEIRGAATIDEILQPLGSRLNVSQFAEVLVRFDFMKVDNATIAVDTGKNLEDVGWKETATPPTGGGSVVLRREIGRTTEFLDNFLRWRLTRVAANPFSATFRVEVMGVR